jgi:Ca-activated chloride channel homolog
MRCQSLSNTACRHYRASLAPGFRRFAGPFTLGLQLLSLIAVTVALAQTDGSRPAAAAAEAALTRNFYFIFDGSGSMGGALDKQCTGDKRFKTRLEGARWAVEQFMPHMPPGVNVGLWVFDSRGNSERVPLGPNKREPFLAEILKTTAGGNTPLTEAIEQGINRLVRQREQQLGYGEFRLIVVTDGQATGRPIPQAVTYAREHRIPIYTIGLCIGQDHELRKYAVSYRAADSVEALKRGLEETLAETNVFDPKTFPGR